MKKVALIQASLLSSPDLVFADICGQPLLGRVLHRVSLCRSLDEVIVATSIKTEDQQIYDFCTETGIACFRGSSTDLVDRFYQAASHYSADILVKLEANCPLIDPYWIDAVSSRVSLSAGRIDYVSNFFPDRTLPHGLDVEAITLPTMRKIWANETNSGNRADVTRLVRTNPDQFIVSSVHLSSVHDADDYSDMRWVVETNEDLELVRKIYAAIGKPEFSWTEALDQYGLHPEWKNINSHISPKRAA